jgi:K+-transporting ATPase KdpF subunit
MNGLYVVWAIVAIGLFVYLGVALLKPERFE